MPKEPHLENIWQSSMVCDGGFVGLLVLAYVFIFALDGLWSSWYVFSPAK